MNKELTVHGARILLLDIETAPGLGWAWAKYQTDVIEFQQPWYMLSFATKWFGEDNITVRGLCDYAKYSPRTNNDLWLVRDLWKFFDEADIIVAHNGDAFDIKKANARFVTHGLPPPSTYKSVDTLKLARKHFRFDSNKLADLGQYLEVGTKLPHTGFQLWKDCMGGDTASWKILKEYNAKDIELLEQVYLKLRAWGSHPDLSLYSGEDKEDVCPTCQSPSVHKRGFSYARTQIRQRWHCNDCGTWYAGKVVKRG